MTFRGQKFFLFALLCFVSDSALARGGQPPSETPGEKSPAPASMATLGDSITAGALANYTLKSWKNPFEFFEILNKLVDAYKTKSLAQLEARELTWGTGDKERSIVNSHTKRLTRLKQNWRDDGYRTFFSYNGAESGKTSLEVWSEQVEPMLEWSRKTLQQGAPDYVAILVGANDLCVSGDEVPTSPAQFEQAISSILTKVYEANPKSKILISEIPNIAQLWDRHKDYRISSFPGARTCRELWKKLKFCDNFLSDDEGLRRQASKSLQEFNAIISRVVQQKIESGISVRVGAGVYDHAIDEEHISVDCFHPTELGQKMISDVTWKSTAWAGLTE